MELSVAQRADGAPSVVTVSGEVDVHSAPQLRDGLTSVLSAADSATDSATDSAADGPAANAAASGVVVDLTGVTFLDSTGLGALVAARTLAGERGITMRLACPSQRIVKLFTITGLDGVFEIHDSLAAALAAGSPTA